MSFLSSEVPAHFVVVIPGFMGSKLRDRTSNKLVWLDFTSIPINPLRWNDWLTHLFGALAYPNDNLEPAGIMDTIVFAPPWAKLEQYSRLVTALQKLGYQVDPDHPSGSRPALYTFAYDWRQDNRISARQLSESMERWRARHPNAKAWIIAHSNGGLVARWYIEQEGGREHVNRLLLMGSPWDGAPKALQVLFSGLTLLRRWPNTLNIAQHTRDVVRTFPSSYQLLPFEDPFLRGTNNETIDVTAISSWLSATQQRLLLDGQHFYDELGTATSVETLCFFGRKQPTTTYGIVHFAAGNRWSDITWGATEAGDGTVPERSAVHPNAIQKLPFTASHGDIYVNPSVVEFLQWELIDKYRAVARASLITDRLTVLFNPDQDIYDPGATITLRAMLLENKDPSPPFSGANIQVQLLWRQALPGEDQSTPLPSPIRVTLAESNHEAGVYEASIVAPETEGYYMLRAMITAVGEPTLILEELIAIEAMSRSVIP